VPDWVKIGPVTRGQRVKLDASGAGTIVFDVFSANSKFELDTVVVRAAGAQPALFPTVILYNGINQADSKSAGGSWVGGQVTFRGKILMDNADSLTVAFTQGVAGTVMTAVIDGTNYLWR
jgi:hypothetical protein